MPGLFTDTEHRLIALITGLPPVHSLRSVVSTSRTEKSSQTRSIPSVALELTRSLRSTALSRRPNSVTPTPSRPREALLQWVLASRGAWLWFSVSGMTTQSTCSGSTALPTLPLATHPLPVSLAALAPPPPESLRVSIQGVLNSHKY